METFFKNSWRLFIKFISYFTTIVFDLNIWHKMCIKFWCVLEGFSAFQRFSVKKVKKKKGVFKVITSHLSVCLFFYLVSNLCSVCVRLCVLACLQHSGCLWPRSIQGEHRWQCSAGTERKDWMNEWMNEGTSGSTKHTAGKADSQSRVQAQGALLFLFFLQTPCKVSPAG